MCDILGNRGAHAEHGEETYGHSRVDKDIDERILFDCGPDLHSRRHGVDTGEDGSLEAIVALIVAALDFGGKASLLEQPLRDDVGLEISKVGNTESRSGNVVGLHTIAIDDRKVLHADAREHIGDIAADRAHTDNGDRARVLRIEQTILHGKIHSRHQASSLQTMGHSVTGWNSTFS